MKKFLFALLRVTGVIRIVAWLNRSRVGILCYHGVTRSAEPLARDPHKLQIPWKLFAEHLEYLQKNYRVVSLEEFLSAKRNQQKLPPYSVVLTFEDGFRNFRTVVAPYLLQTGLPATTFLITNQSFAANGSNGNHRWQPNDDHSFLSWKDVQDLASKRIQFGSHTCSHPNLLNLSLKEANIEFAESREAICKQVGETDIPLSYPYGIATDELSRLAQALGYSCGLTTELGLNNGDTDLFALKRTVIASDDDLATFAARVSGLTWWTDKILRFFRRKPAGLPEPVSFGELTARELDI